MWPFSSKSPVTAQAFLELQRQVTRLEGELAALESKHMTLRGAFYQARQGLAADGITPIQPRERGETKEEFRARKLAALRGSGARQE